MKIGTATTGTGQVNLTAGTLTAGNITLNNGALTLANQSTITAASVTLNHLNAQVVFQIDAPTYAAQLQLGTGDTTNTNGTFIIDLTNYNFTQPLSITLVTLDKTAFTYEDTTAITWKLLHNGTTYNLDGTQDTLIKSILNIATFDYGWNSLTQSGIDGAYHLTIAPVPEPATTAAVLALLTLATITLRRRKK
jgi:hypothetical protein